MDHFGNLNVNCVMIVVLSDIVYFYLIYVLSGCLYECEIGNHIHWYPYMIVHVRVEWGYWLLGICETKFFLKLLLPFECCIWNQMGSLFLQSIWNSYIGVLLAFNDMFIIWNFRTSLNNFVFQCFHYCLWWCFHLFVCLFFWKG